MVPAMGKSKKGAKAKRKAKPELGRDITLYLKPSSIKKLAEAAKDSDMSLSGVVAELIEWHLGD